MEDPELIYCEVKDMVKEVQPLPPPLPNRDHIPASFIKINPSRRMPPPKTLTVITNSCKRCTHSRNTTSRKQVVLMAIAIGILAILSTVFVTMYFTTEGKGKPCDCQNCFVSNCSTITWKNTVPKSCSDIYKKGVKIDGIYRIEPDGLGAFNVRCDMTTNGGGWTVFQRRIDGSVHFYRGWNDYKKGFGDLNDEFWLGLDNIHRLSKIRQNVLRVDLEDFEKETRYADYSAFAVANETEKYKLTVGGYSGDAGDSLDYHNGMKFCTKDADNDHLNDIDCAVLYKGAWWYNECHYANLNAQYLRGNHISFADGVNWRLWKGDYYSLKKTEMKIRPGSF